MENLLITFLLGLLAIVITLTIHEFFHAYVAFRCGDPTAKYEGRVTLNPLAHIDPFGGAILLFTLLFSSMTSGAFVIGWAKPVPVNENYMGNPRRDNFLVSMAGPLSNLMLAALSGLLLKLEFFHPVSLPGAFIDMLVRVNLSLGLFNLLPVPPLDGWKIIQTFLPSQLVYGMKHFEARNPHVIYVILAFVIFSGIVQLILGPPYLFLYNLLTS